MKFIEEIISIAFQLYLSFFFTYPCTNTTCLNRGLQLPLATSINSNGIVRIVMLYHGGCQIPSISVTTTQNFKDDVARCNSSHFHVTDRIFDRWHMRLHMQVIFEDISVIYHANVCENHLPLRNSVIRTDIFMIPSQASDGSVDKYSNYRGLGTCVLPNRVSRTL